MEQERIDIRGGPVVSSARTPVGGEMLQRGYSPTSFLDTADQCRSYLPGQIRVLSESFLSPGPAGISRDIQSGFQVEAAHSPVGNVTASIAIST